MTITAEAPNPDGGHGLKVRPAPARPRINDGSLLFLQHMISKMKDPEGGGTRLAIGFNGSPPGAKNFFSAQRRTFFLR